VITGIAVVAVIAGLSYVRTGPAVPPASAQPKAPATQAGVQRAKSQASNGFDISLTTKIFLDVDPLAQRLPPNLDGLTEESSHASHRYRSLWS
jgi:hypothetical protein